MKRHETAVLAEQAIAESRVLLEAPTQAKSMGFVDVVSQLREKSKCATCGKTTLVLNLARRGYRPERVTPATHCTCQGGPAYEMDAPDPAPTTYPTDSEGAEAL